MSLWDTRTDYDKHALNESDAPDLPHVLFEQWMQVALDAQLPDANAMALSTLNAEGFPTARIVLLRAQQKDRFSFFTNYHSSKGHELAKNPKCSVLFFWPTLERQVRIFGECLRVPEEESDEYFASRPRSSQLGAWASDQSHPIKNRDFLAERMAYFEKQFPDAIPRPPHWGGFALHANAYEFWQGQPSRLHDRLYYKQSDKNQKSEKKNSVWQRHRLSP